MDPKAFTGRARKRKTTWRVALADRAARTLITLGGLGTIGAVALVFVFLVWVAVPIFLPTRVEPAGGVAIEGVRPGERPVLVRLDEYQVLGWTLFDDGAVEVFRADTGALLERKEPGGGPRPTALAFLPADGRTAAGYADGTVRLGRAGFRTDFPDPAGLPPEVRDLPEGAVAELGGGIAQRTPEGQIRRQAFSWEQEEPLEVGEGSPIARLDLSVHGDTPRILAWTGDGKLRVLEVSAKKNLLTGKVRYESSGGAVAVPEAASRGTPDWLLLGGVGNAAFAAWRDGRLLRFDTRDPEKPALAEAVDLLPAPGRTLTSVAFLLGKATLLAGDSTGEIRAWFQVRPPNAGTIDGSALRCARTFPGRGAGVTAFAPSERTRLLAAGYADGTARVYHVTSERLVGEGSGAGGPVDALTLTPKQDGLVATVGARLTRWSVRAPHPEITVPAIFGKVWYEGADGPEHTWQSSSGTDDFEPKYGLVPLVFGTLKATLYSMLFAVPLAILAALFTSEFLRPEVRARVKPTIELMASLPSVVLGFLAGVLFAPFLEGWVPESLACLATVPFSLLLGAHLWQLLPRGRAAALEKWKVLLCGAFALAGIALSLAVGPVLESLLFAGDVMAWLDGQRGSGAGGWFLVLLPASAVLVLAAGPRLPGPRLPAASAGGSRAREGRVLLARFLLGSAAATGLAAALSLGLAGLGFDPRGSFVGTYVQRNALVVGFVMGFAVIPIIYTLAEDALAAVPEHLRAASLAVGATRWQTAVSVILPTAASGLFSACMIGLGRAVGETMIVLMAAGNTPVLEWNVFNGFRTLSANIAVELPEAVQGSTGYRMLFLAALTLFLMTFVLNTAAEAVRQRFRRRAFEL